MAPFYGWGATASRLQSHKLKAINLSTLTWSFYMIEKGEELPLMLIIHIIRKRNGPVNIILLSTLHDQVSTSFNFLRLGSANILKLLVK